MLGTADWFDRGNRKQDLGSLRGKLKMCADGFPQPLDVILVRGTDAASTFLCGLQSVRMLQRVSFSHVVLSIAAGTCLHATTKGVHLIRTQELWTSALYQSKKVVLRNNKIKQQLQPTAADLEELSAYFEAPSNDGVPEIDPCTVASDDVKNGEQPFTQRDLIKKAVDFTGEAFGARYNIYFGIPKRWLRARSWFCSELAADALKRCGRNVDSNRDPEQIFPGHFQRCQSQKDEWLDVTGIYEDYFKEVIKGDDEARSRHSVDEAEFLVFNNAYTVMETAKKLIKVANKRKGHL
jgi:hypothetical protein